MNGSRQIAKLFRSNDLTVKELCTGMGDDILQLPAITVDHTSYPGVEAHLFTIAAAAQWKAQFTNERDVLLCHPIINIETEGQKELIERRAQAWNRLTSVLSSIMESMKLYKDYITHGDFATVIWGHHATEWHREMWDSRVHEYVRPSDFIEYVDPSIRAYITELNDLGFSTVESCSGMLIDHPDREPYKPYVMFDERSYCGSAPHYFTLGDMAGWESMYAPHGFDVYIRVFSEDDIETAWSRLLTKARVLGPLLSTYRKSSVSIGTSHPNCDRLSDEDDDDSAGHLIEDRTRRMLGLNGVQ